MRGITFVVFGAVLVVALLTTFTAINLQGQFELREAIAKIVEKSCFPSPPCRQESPPTFGTSPDGIKSDGPMIKPRPILQAKMVRVRKLLAKKKFPQYHFEKYVMPFFLFESPFECIIGEDRVGDIGDGGKWICGVQRLIEKPNCIVYSLGSNGQLDFERDLDAATAGKCEIHSFDVGNFTKVFSKTQFHFHQVFIGPDDQTRNSKTLQTIMRELGHNHIDVLKMDIEKGEYAVLSMLANSTVWKPWIGQLLVEIHFHPPEYEASMFSVFNEIDRLILNAQSIGLQQFHREPNPINGWCCEFAFGNINPRPF